MENDEKRFICIKCGYLTAVFQKKAFSFAARIGLVKIEDVPSFLCESCDMEWVSEETLRIVNDKIDGMTNKELKVKTYTFIM